MDASFSAIESLDVFFREKKKVNRLSVFDLPIL